MTTTVVLRHVERSRGNLRLREASRLAASARLRPPQLRRVARDRDDPGIGVDVVRETTTGRPLVLVAHLWLGVLSIFALIVFLGLTVIILGAWAMGFRPVVVSSGSMEPLVRPGDVVITKPIDAHDKIGDQTVVDFDDPATDERRLHRVIEVTKDGYRTKGDANQTADSELVPQEAVHGAGLVLAPFVGYIPLWFSDGDWPKLGATGLALVALAVMSRRRWMWSGEAP